MFKMLISWDLGEFTEENNHPAFKRNQKPNNCSYSVPWEFVFISVQLSFKSPQETSLLPHHVTSKHSTHSDRKRAKVKCAQMHVFTGPALSPEKGTSLSGFIDRVFSASAAMTIRSAILYCTVYELQSRVARRERMMDCGDVKER